MLGKHWKFVKNWSRPFPKLHVVERLRGSFETTLQGLLHAQTSLNYFCLGLELKNVLVAVQPREKNHGNPLNFPLSPFGVKGRLGHFASPHRDICAFLISLSPTSCPTNLQRAIRSSVPSYRHILYSIPSFPIPLARLARAGGGNWGFEPRAQHRKEPLGRVSVLCQVRSSPPHVACAIGFDSREEGLSAFVLGPLFFTP